MPISMIPQGTKERNEDIRSPTGDVVGVMNLTMGYQWMRSTTDYGGYGGPEILVMPSRKLRGTRYMILSVCQDLTLSPVGQIKLLRGCGR